MADLRYPIGPFSFDSEATDADRQAWIRTIAGLPAAMRDAVAGLTESRLDEPYRPGGWTVRQVVHHVPDSHMNAYVRFKLALTEDRPTIKPYDEAAWAKLADTARTPIGTSLSLLEALHGRWVTLLESMKAQDFRRELLHPEQGTITTGWLLQMYAWHGRHHTAHITELRRRQSW